MKMMFQKLKGRTHARAHEHTHVHTYAHARARTHTNRMFPIEVENSQNTPNNKTRQKKDVSKYRPISLINVGGKVLEKILINRIMHYIYSNNLMNKNQFGFTPRKSSTDTTFAVKDYIEEGIKQGHTTVLIRLDVRGAFDAAWWPSILHALK